MNIKLDKPQFYNLNQISSIIGGILNQIEDGIKITKIAPPKLADENTLALAISEEEIKNLACTNAKAAIVPLGVSIESISTIEVERPRLAMMKLLHLFYIPPDAPAGIHETAVIHPDAKIGKNVSIGANAFVGRNSEIGDNTKLLPNVYVGKNVKIGNNCLFHANACVGDAVSIGNQVIIHHGASIGADGFSFVTENPGNIEVAKEEGKIDGDFSQQKIYKIPSLGSVTINDDVEIGANAAIDRGTIENTIIGKGTKIDNLVMIGHNCNIGENCLVVSQVGISGSVKVGNRVVLAGQAGVADHVTIGDDVIVMAQSGVSKNIKDKDIVMGTPATSRKIFAKHAKGLKQIETINKEIKDLKNEIEQLKKEK